MEEEITALVKQQEGFFAIAFKDLTSGEELLINSHESFHAASTMKTPVMIEVLRQAAGGKFALTDSVLVRNEFKSIIDGSPYSLKPGDDSEPVIYRNVGKKYTISDLVYVMITSSSNLATNILILIGQCNRVWFYKCLGIIIF